MNVFRHLLNRALAHITRFNSQPQHFRESVAEHSFFVTYYTSIICRSLEEGGESVDTRKAMEMALVHDMEERFSGDILSPFKYYSPEVTRAIRTVNEEIIKNVFEGLPGYLANSYVALWKEEGKGETLEAQIVKLADKLSLLSKCAEEAETGNEFFSSLYQETLEKLYEYESPWWNHIKYAILEDAKKEK